MTDKTDKVEGKTIVTFHLEDSLSRGLMLLAMDLRHGGTKSVSRTQLLNTSAKMLLDLYDNGNGLADVKEVIDNA